MRRLHKIAATYRGLAPGERARLGGMAAAVLGLHILGFSLLFSAVALHAHVARDQIFGVGTGFLAYTLGMRHAFDADHISAIDNTTRKLMSDGKRPLSVGFFFSLGHSTIVVLLTVLLGVGVSALGAQVRHSNSGLHAVAGIVGTSVSGAFLYLIAALNLVVLVSIARLFVAIRRGTFAEDELEAQLEKRGMMSRVLGPLARRIDRPGKMYPVGLLFGLGFDTATEVALLVLSGTAVAGGLPLWAILSLPILFTAGMSLFDTADGCFMNFAYGWAFSRPVRKVYYNLTMTGLSVVIAFFVGSIELGGLLSQEVHLSGSFWSWMQNFNLNVAGFAIVGLFAVTWIGALAIWRFGRIEDRWEAAALRADQNGLGAGAGHTSSLGGFGFAGDPADLVNPDPDPATPTSWLRSSVQGGP